MKTNLLLLSLFLFTVGCQNGDHISPATSIASSYNSPTLRNGHLVFDDFASFAYLIAIPKENKAEWDKRWQELPSFSSLEEAIKKPNSQLKLSDSHSTQLNRLMNEKGIMEVQGALLTFTAEWTKVLTGFKGTQAEIDALLSTVKSSPSDRITVYPVNEFPLSRPSSQARSTNFNTCQNGNYIFIPYPPDYGFTYIKGCAVGYQRVTGLPGITPLKYYYNVTASADIYTTDSERENDQLNNSNVGSVFFNWVTDKGSSSVSGTNYATIYGAFAANYPQDIDGYVTIGNTFNVFGNLEVSQTTINF